VYFAYFEARKFEKLKNLVEFFILIGKIIVKFIRINLNIGLLTLIYGEMMTQSRQFVQKFTMN
jgi:hypothetical protein